MALPKLNNPTYELVVPSTQEKVTYRPFLVKEQKILMIAQESSDPAMMTRTVCQLVENCVSGIDDAMKLPTFDVEYMFMRLRAVSVGAKVELMMLCSDDEKTQVPVEINIEDIYCYVYAYIYRFRGKYPRPRSTDQGDTPSLGVRGEG